ncbi:hypothetical protein NG798_23825 [Ancylothrix sp. C2]|uniref:hypothetical protein n=1 Tax=Ancylothrix sp. D3o TaxID=2953691 RepID=UPI0021BAA539|nr:hypothetical protein [Ancylothrix sp. D3o]MCT7952834.1 hypothetical protein [Ancylothrix sp. D3o]
MNDNEKIIKCKEIIKKILAQTPDNQIPVFSIPSDLVSCFSIAAQEMMEEFKTRQAIPLIIVEDDSARGATQLFFTLTLLAETVGKMTRSEPKKIIKRFAKSAEEMLSSMTTSEVIDYCEKYDLPIGRDLQ